MSKAETETEIKAELLSPDARTANNRIESVEINGVEEQYTVMDKCPEIMLKDLRIGNLNEDELKLANMGIDILHTIRYLTENSGVDLSNVYKHFYNDILSPFHTSNSKNGYMEELMVTRKLESVEKQSQSFRDITQPEEKKGFFSFMKKK